jgi:hypothetical protein
MKRSSKAQETPSARTGCPRWVDEKCSNESRRSRKGSGAKRRGATWRRALVRPGAWLSSPKRPRAAAEAWVNRPLRGRSALMKGPVFLGGQAHPQGKYRRTKARQGCPDSLDLKAFLAGLSPGGIGAAVLEAAAGVRGGLTVTEALRQPLARMEQSREPTVRELPVSKNALSSPKTWQANPCGSRA